MNLCASILVSVRYRFLNMLALASLCLVYVVFLCESISVLSTCMSISITKDKVEHP